MLKPVRLLKHDTCYTYALKRVGQYAEEYVMMESNEFISKFMMEQVEEKELVTGDLLCYVWPSDESRIVRVETEISENREIIMNTKDYNVHFMVYEGGGLISHAILVDVNKYNVHKVCMRRLCDGADDWFRIKYR